MDHEHKITVINKEGQELEIKRGGNILTDRIIFDRPDLLEQCPDEIQKALKLYQAGLNSFSSGQYENGRQLIEEAFECISVRN